MLQSVISTLLSAKHCSRAKLLRKEQNRRAYSLRTQDRSKLLPTWPTIPQAVHEQSSLPLPTHSHFFKQEFRYREDVSDVDALAKWDRLPPYSAKSASFGSVALDVTVDRIHGRRLREQYHYEVRRLERYRSRLNDDEILAEIDHDICQYFATWMELKVFLQLRPKSPIDHTMGHLLLQWKARRITDLLADWKVAKKGCSKGAFMTHFTDRWSKY